MVRRGQAEMRVQGGVLIDVAKAARAKRDVSEAQAGGEI